MKRMMKRWQTYLNEGGLTIQKHTGRKGRYSREVFRDQLNFYLGGTYQQFQDIGEILQKISATDQEKQSMANDLGGMINYYTTRGAVEYFDGEPLEVVSVDRIRELLNILAGQGFIAINPTNPKTIEEFYVMGKDLTAPRSQPLPAAPSSKEEPKTSRLAKTAAMSYDDIMKLQTKRKRRR